MRQDQSMVLNAFTTMCGNYPPPYFRTLFPAYTPCAPLLMTGF